MRKIAVCGGLLLGMLCSMVLASCGKFSGSSGSGVVQGCGAATLLPTATPTGSVDQGSGSGSDTGTDVTPPPTTPGPCFGAPAIAVPMTMAKIVSYVSSHPLQRNQAEGQISAIKVQEFAAADAPLLLQGDSVIANGPNIWYAELQGQFAFGGPAGSDNTSTYQYGFEVFDDTSGNLLASGGRVSPICDYSTADTVCQPVIPITPSGHAHTVNAMGRGWKWKLSFLWHSFHNNGIFLRESRCHISGGDCHIL